MKVSLSRQRSLTSVELTPSRPPSNRSKRYSGTLVRVDLLAALESEGAGPLLYQDRRRIGSRERTPSTCRAVVPASHLHLVISNPSLIPYYRMAGGDTSMDCERPPIQTTIEEWASASAAKGETSVEFQDEDEVSVQLQLCLAMMGRCELTSLLRRWNHQQLERTTLQVLALDLMCPSESNIKEVCERLEKFQREAIGDNWNRVLQALDRHLMPRVLHWIDEHSSFPSHLLARLLSFFPRIQPYLESIQKHGRSGMLSCLRSGMIRHLAGVPHTVKLTPTTKMKLVDLILEDSKAYQYYVMDMNLERLHLYRESIPWDTTVEVEQQLLHYPPGDLVWYCSPKSVIRGALRNNSEVQVKKAKLEIERLQHEANSLELPDPRSFLDLLNWLLSQLDNASLV